MQDGTLKEPLPTETEEKSDKVNRMLQQKEEAQTAETIQGANLSETMDKGAW